MAREGEKEKAQAVASSRFCSVDAPVRFSDLFGSPRPASLVIPSDDSFLVSVTPDLCPLDRVASSLRDMHPLELSAGAYSLDEDVLDALTELGRRGKLSSQEWTLDQKETEKIPEEELQEWLSSSGAFLSTRPNHAKWFCFSAQGRVASLLSSSNEGAGVSHTEWWASCRDVRLHDFLVGARLGTGNVPDACSASLSRPVVLLSDDTPSVSVLESALSCVGGRPSLRLVSWSTSAGFVKDIRSMRDRGLLGDLTWVLDRSFRSRRSSSRRGMGDVVSVLEESFPGEYQFAERRIHGKWASVCSGSDSVSILTSANWQRKNPRTESYVLVPGSEVSEGLHRVERRLLGEEVPVLRLVPAGDDYSVLGVWPDSSREELDAALLTSCSRYVPDRPYVEDVCEYSAAVRAYCKLTDTPQDLSEPPDWLLAWLPRARQQALDIRDGEDDPVPLLDDVRQELLDNLPGYIPGSRLSRLDGFDVHEILVRLVSWPEFAGLPSDLREAVEVVWRAKSWSDHGRSTLGTCECISERERALWDGPVGARPPLWRITLSLSYWLLASEVERERLVHHELSHAVLAVRDDGDPRAGTVPHELEESRATAERYGARDVQQALVARALMRHPRTLELLSGSPDAGGVLPVVEERIARENYSGGSYDDVVRKMMRGIPCP